MPRKKPFSVKQKRKQLRDKRERKKDRTDGVKGQSLTYSDDEGQESEVTSMPCDDKVDLRRINEQPVFSKPGEKGYDPNRYRLHFMKESRAEIERRKKIAREKVICQVPETNLEVAIEDIYQPGSVLDMPKRPPWTYGESKVHLEWKEETYFLTYLEKIYNTYSMERLSYFEHNLETWRQLWRVLEISDIILLITDIRHPVLHFSPALYDYVTKELGKSLVLVLNKIDLAPPALVVAWRSYFKSKFPQVEVVCFTSFPKEHAEDEKDPGTVLQKKRRRPGRDMKAVGPSELLGACEKICNGRVDLASWAEKIAAAEAGGETDDDKDEDTSVPDPPEETDQDRSSPYLQFRDGVLTIGCVGHPNVGKSSLMNGLVGSKVVSTSRTPGHTKHFQTIFLTPTVRLCDSPGLIFPSLTDKQLQVLSGTYPLPQLQEPYTSVGYLAARVPVVRLLNLRHPDNDPTQPQGARQEQWCAWDICDAWAEKRGFRTAKMARTDVYRAANSILRMALEGRICLCVKPPGYTKHQRDWEAHPETSEISALQDRSTGGAAEDSSSDFSSSEEEAGKEPARGRRDGEPQEEETVAMSNPFDLLADDD
ncbi:GNL1 [Branchiostoma lanceolatum]|uniref:Guanine nucleotide-binding protein-like 1 n=1 Tax=Branchiostoma lanceolatum TaxID=7740 RepID=A0A8K0AHA4_BRALA|nr:GNL1 [Branchiostoma lanceolatum]